MAQTTPPVLGGLTDDEIVEDTRSYLRAADGAEQVSSDARWAAADRIVTLRERGWTRARIGEGVGMTHGTVRNYEAAARLFVLRDKRPAWHEAQRQVRDDNTTEARDLVGARSALREAPPEQIEQIVASLPPERREVLERATERVVDREIAARYGATPEQVAERRSEGRMDDYARSNEAGEIWQAVTRHLVHSLTSLRSAARELGRRGERLDTDQRASVDLFLERISELAATLRAANLAGEALTDEALAAFLADLPGEAG